MSYAIYLYHPSVRATVEQGQELDEFTHAPLSTPAVSAFLKALEIWGYVPRSLTTEPKTFTKSVGDSHVDVSIFDTEIAFSVHGGDQDAVFEMLQDACEMYDSEQMALFDPQTGEWQEN